MLTGLALTAAFLAGVAVVLALALVSMHRRHHPRFALPNTVGVGRDLPSLAGISYGELSRGNHVELVEDGSYLDASLRLIGEAERSVHLETFLWRTGVMSAQIASALAERARAGVEVRVLLDSLGSGGAREDELDRIRAAGARVLFVRPIGLRDLGWVNNRTHRKILVADGRTAIVGGHCVDDRWIGGDGQHPEVRDVSVRVEGPIVRSIQSAFCENWIETAGEVPYGDGVFPQLASRGEALAHLAYVRPSGGVAAVKLLHHVALRVATERLWIQSPYFVPDGPARDALIDAAARGVDVRVMFPTLKASDNRLVAHASRYRLAPLLDHGVRLFEYHRTLLHQKIWTVDREYALVGSANFDERSFDLDDQVTLAVADRRLVAALDLRFTADLEHATPIQSERWHARPAAEKARDALAYLLREQL